MDFFGFLQFYGFVGWKDVKRCENIRASWSEELLLQVNAWTSREQLLLETAEVTPSSCEGSPHGLSPWNSAHHVKKVAPTISAIRRRFLDKSLKWDILKMVKPWERKLHHSQKWVKNICFGILLTWTSFYCANPSVNAAFMGVMKIYANGPREYLWLHFMKEIQGKPIVNTDLVRIVKRALRASSLNLQVWGHSWSYLWLHMPGGESNEVRTGANEVRTRSNVLTCSLFLPFLYLPLFSFLFFPFLSLCVFISYFLLDIDISANVILWLLLLTWTQVGATLPEASPHANRNIYPGPENFNRCE
jgi:hypothetical protein